jgi:DNA-binding NarL/FixJ family response regulator/RecA/RadA recombinase
VTSVVGREAELALVDAYLAGEPTGRTLAIVGEPGIGKTTVWSEAVARARRSETTVLVARPSESEATLAFAGLADLLAGAPEDRLAALPAPQRDALEVALLRMPARRPPERRLVGTALLSLLRGLAATPGGVALGVDDLQWLDAPSAAAIGFALRRLGAEPVRALLAVRSGEAERSLVAELEHDERLVRVELGPLSVAALHRILSQELGRTFPRPTLVRIGQLSDGNALYALEIARRLEREDGRDLHELPVPESLQTLVAARVHALPFETRAALLRAAALARPDLRLVGAAALAPAEEAGLVRIAAGDRVEFAHPLFASAVYSSTPLARRREAHRELAAAVADPDEIVRHLALACDGPDAEVAGALRDAARRARARGAPETAAELAQLALRLLPDDDVSRDELRLEVAGYLSFAGDFQRARRLLEELRGDLEPGDLLARAMLTLAEIDYWRKGESAALALGEEALAVARGPLVRARCHVAIAMDAGTVDLPKAAAAARTALELLDSRTDAEPDLVSAALGARVRADLFLGEGLDVEAAERALALEGNSAAGAVDTRAVFKLGQWLRYVDDFDGARAKLAAAERAAVEEGDESSLANILLNRVALETWAGNWSEAAELTGRMNDAFEQLGTDPGGLGPWLVYVDAHAGRPQPVQAVAARGRPREPIVAAILDRCLGLVELAAGDYQAADRDLSAALAEIDRVGFREPGVWRVEGDAIEAAVGVGDLSRAEALVSLFEERAARSRIPWSLAVSARCRGLLLAARGELEEAAAALERADAEHERCPLPFERARTLLVQGQVLRRLKRKRQARASLEEALAIFRRLGAEAWERRAEAELARVVVRRAPNELSATELRIATLAAAGLTNKAIAAEVFVTQKAVEANLARAYRKLGIRSRAQLARALDARSG